MIALAIESGIDPETWWSQEERTLLTALDILRVAHEQAHRAAGPRRADPEGMVISG